MIAAADQLNAIKVITETVPHVVGGLVVAVLLGLTAWVARRLHIRWGAVKPAPEAAPQVTESRAGADRQPLPADPGPDRPEFRTYTLLTTKSGSGGPERMVSNHPAGTAIVHLVDGRTVQFVLTNTPLFDGSYVAEPLHRYP